MYGNNTRFILFKNEQTIAMKTISEIKINSIQIIFAIATSAAFLCFCILKALNTPLTHDEGLTFFNYVSLNVRDIIAYKNPMNNNHILNSLMMKMCSAIFGNSEISLRLPNLICFVVFAFYSFLILKPVNKFLFFPAYLLLFTNPFLLDFFFLARGYGMAIAFMTAGIYYFIKYHKEYRLVDLIICLTFIFLSILSNFALLHFAVALILTHNFLWLFKKAESNPFFSFLKYNTPILVFTAISTILLYQPLHVIVESNLLEVGGGNGFIEDTLNSLIDASAYGNSNSFFELLTQLILFLFGINVIIGIALFIKHRTNSISLFKEYFIALFLLAFVVIEIVLQHNIIGTPYIVNRFALFLVPLFWYSTILFVDMVIKEYKTNNYTIGIYLISIFFLFHTVTASNKQSSYIWKYDADNKKMLDELFVISEGKPVRLGISWIFEPSLNYYRTTKDLDWLNELTRDHFAGEYNYFYATEEDYKNLTATKKLEVIEHFEYSNNYLLKAIE